MMLQLKENYIKEITINGQNLNFYDIARVAEDLGFAIDRLPFSLRVLFENILRNSDDLEQLKYFKNWLDKTDFKKAVEYSPARVLMQDFTGVPAIVDLAAMRDACAKLGKDPKIINPQIPVDLVIDHSVQVDSYNQKDSLAINTQLEYERNKERYEFLKWGQKNLENFRVVPPGTGICHQVNLEYLSNIIATKEIDGKNFVFPDSLVGTDSHTTMVNGLAVLGWGVGGIEAEAAMLGQSITMLLPEVIGFKLKGKLQPGVTATDLVLSITNILRAKNVVGKFIEFFGEGLDDLPLADRATISNMAPEYGATCSFFAIDNESINFMRQTARDDKHVELVQQLAKSQNLWRDSDQLHPQFTEIVELDLAEIEPSIAGPKRPQDKISLKNAAKAFKSELTNLTKSPEHFSATAKITKGDYNIENGSVVIAAITSCTNTSNPYVMVAAGLVAKKARQLGLNAKPWVKTSLAPGSQVVTEYLKADNLLNDLAEIGFDLVGYGCTTCIGNSGPLKPEIEDAIRENDLIVSSVLSGNRNFEGRVHPLSKTNYLASPPLVVVYAIAGNMNIDLINEPIAEKDGKKIFMKDIWPSNKEVKDFVERVVTPKMFAEKYGEVFKGDDYWQHEIKADESATYNWQQESTYINNPPYFDDLAASSQLSSIKDAKLLAKFGDSITTDHISPAGNIAKNSPAAEYLNSKNVKVADYNSYGARRGNHEVMMRGTFANIRIRNELCPGIEGGYTKISPSDNMVSIYDAAMHYKKSNTDLIIIAGKEYGTGSSRDWAAKGTKLLGVKAVIAESFERIHRSNLIGMGVLPFQFVDTDRNKLNLTGNELFSIENLEGLEPGADAWLEIKYNDGSTQKVKLKSRIDTSTELEYIQAGGILHKVLHEL